MIATTLKYVDDLDVVDDADDVDDVDDGDDPDGVDHDDGGDPDDVDDEGGEGRLCVHLLVFPQRHHGVGPEVTALGLTTKLGPVDREFRNSLWHVLRYIFLVSLKPV